jgi:hypothetical protein
MNLKSANESPRTEEARTDVAAIDDRDQVAHACLPGNIDGVEPNAPRAQADPLRAKTRPIVT